MSYRIGGVPQGGGGGGGRGSGNAPQPPSQLLSGLSLHASKNVAVDGSPLQMDNPVAEPRPNPMPSNIIDAEVSLKILGGRQVSKLQSEFPLRGAFNVPNTMVYTNSFAMKFDPTMPLYEYKIIGLPERVGRRTAKVLVQKVIHSNPFLKNHQDKFATDYKGTLVSWIRLPNLGLMEVQSADWREPVSIRLEYVRPVDIALLQQYAEGKLEPTKDMEVQIRWVSTALNMVLSTVLSRGSFSLRANKFFITGGHKDLGLSFCAIRGYYYSVRPGLGQVLLNLSSCTSAFYKPILVSDFLKDDTTFKNQNDRLAQLRGPQVQLTYDPVHPSKQPRSPTAEIAARIKTIAGTGKAVGKQTFILKGRDGTADTEITVQGHFEGTYNTNPLNPNMPAINCGTDIQPRWYLPEKLLILPYQMYKRQVPESLTASMLDVAAHHPDTTRALIEHEGLRHMGLNPGAALAPFPGCPAIQIDSRMLQVPATVLQYPRPKYGNGPVIMKSPSWNLNKRKFLFTKGKTVLKSFIIAVPRDDKGKSALRDTDFLMQTWKDFSSTMQTTYTTATFQFVGLAINSNIQDSIDQARAKEANFVMLVLEKKSTQSYSTFKDLSDRRYGMHSLCVVWDPKKGFSSQYWGNVAMKINLKVGGINHTADGIEQIMKDTLVLGADVTHAGTGSLIGTPSIAAIVGSVTTNGGKFLGSMRVQERNTACEIIEDVEVMVFERLKDWYENNGRTLPKHILYYRDGVSDSQYSQVKDHEISQIRTAFAKAANMVNLATPTELKITALVVAKRHHVKLFPTAADAMPKNGNCKPGTLVDTAITSPYYSDFYLQSHNGIKGTARPAHYFPLVNEMGLSEMAMQTFTHKLCYTYVRATMGVSYAPPAYYADRLCERGRCYVRDFLAPGPDSPMALAHKDFKDKLIHHFRTAREQKYKHKRTKLVIHGQVRMMKHADEKKQERLDEAQVEVLLKEWTFQKAKKTFYGGDTVRNPWNPNITKTMFWM